MAWHKRLFLLLLIFLPTQLGYHSWPVWSTVLGRRIDYLSPTLYVTDILIVCILLFWWVYKVRNASDASWKKMRDVRTNVSTRVLQYALAASIFVVLNVLSAVSKPVSIYMWGKVFEYFLLGWYIVQTKPSNRLVVVGLSIGLIYSSILAIFQFTFQHSVGSILWWLGERTFSVSTPGIARLSWCAFPAITGCREILRAYATFPHPNVLGGYVATVLPFIIWRILRYKFTILKYIGWIISIFGVIALLLSFSRSAWVVAGVSVVYVIYGLRKKYMQFVFSTAVILCIGLILVLPSYGDESVVRRAELNQSAITLWQHSPFFGVGLGNYIVRLPETSVSRQANFLQPVHNIYLLVLSETGIIGLLGMVILIGVNIWKSVRDVPKSGLRRGYYSIYTVSLFCMLLLGLADHYVFSLQQGQLLFTIFLSLTSVSKTISN